METTNTCTTNESPLIAAYRAERLAETMHRFLYGRLMAANPTEQDYAAYREGCAKLDAARSVSSKLDAEMNARARF